MSAQYTDPYLPGLAIDSPDIRSNAKHFKPTTWPPLDDFPISVDTNGNVISYFADHSWDMSFWNGSSLKLNFSDGPKLTKKQKRIDPLNAHLLRIIAAYWLYEKKPIMQPRSLKSQINIIKPLFSFCTSIGISASELYRHPRVVDDFMASLREKKDTERLLSELHRLWHARVEIGFTLLDQEALIKLASIINKRQSVQFAYIPPRIWTYQNLRLREFLDDFTKHQSDVERCFDFCMKSYIYNCDPNEKTLKLPNNWLPFLSRNRNRKTSGKLFYGKFRLTAENFCIADLLDKWVDFSDKRGIQAFTAYLSLASIVGLIYIVNFSLMRRDEGSELRFNCLSVECDIFNQKIYLISGKTTKTQADDDAQWIVSETAAYAVKVMQSVTRLRISASQFNSEIRLTQEEIDNPLLQTRAYEPWSGLKHYRGIEKKQTQSLSLLLKASPKLMNQEQLRITECDLAISRQINDQLPNDSFGIGQVWPLSWHQFRRSGAVNMLSSGLVTESDLCYQLKHLNRLMSRYYGNNYRYLQASLNKQAGGTYIAEVYEALARQAKQLLSEHHISPHGEKRKAQILETIGSKTHLELVKLAKAGQVDYHETFLGGCAKPGSPCPLGGVSNISSCMGHNDLKPCKWVILNQKNRPVITRLLDVLHEMIQPENEGSMLHKSLTAQIESAQRALEVFDAN